MADNRWRPQPHAMVHIDPADGQLNPPGTWMIMCHGPNGPASWWLLAASDEARRWAAANPTQITSRCVQIDGRRLTSTRIRAHQGQPRHG